MKLITRDTDYAVRALCYLAHHKEGASVTEIARELGMPRPFLRKILQSLTRSGVLRSRKGVGGGFYLKAKPGKIRITDIATIFQGGIRLNECTLKRKACPLTGHCQLKMNLDDIERDVIHRLRSLTIGTLA